MGTKDEMQSDGSRIAQTIGDGDGELAADADARLRVDPVDIGGARMSGPGAEPR